jgi:hypothetical protein
MCLVYLETPRFTIRSWKPEDADIHGESYDPQVHQYTGDKSWPLERATNYIKLCWRKISEF